MSEYFGTSTGGIAPSVTGMRVFSFLANPRACSEVWALVAGGMNNNGPLEIRLIDQYGTAMSDWAECHSSSLSRIKLQGVRISADPDGFPQVLTVEATNRSTASHSTARVSGVRLVYDE